MKTAGSNAYFQIAPNSKLIGNKVFDSAEKCAAEMAGMKLICDRVRMRILPPVRMQQASPLKITMAAYTTTLENAISKRSITPEDLQHVIFVVTDMLLAMANEKMLLMDCHVGNVMLKYFKDALVDVAIIDIDPNLFHDYSTGKLPSHSRRCPFDPLYDCAFFSYSVLGMCIAYNYPCPITPLSERDLVAYDAFIDSQHRWDMAVGGFPYYPKKVVEFQKYRHGSRP